MSGAIVSLTFNDVDKVEIIADDVKTQNILRLMFEGRVSWKAEVKDGVCVVLTPTVPKGGE